MRGHETQVWCLAVVAVAMVPGARSGRTLP